MTSRTSSHACGNFTGAAPIPSRWSRWTSTQIIEEVIELTRPRWRDISQREGISIQIQTELEPKLPLLLSDPSDLREALINLVFNAVDAMPQGGTITFVTRSVKSPLPKKTKLPNAIAGRSPGQGRRHGRKDPATLPWSRFFPPSPNAAAPAWVWRWFMA